MHPDHVLGAPFFEEAGAAVVGHAAFDRALADRLENYEQSLSRLIGPAAFLGSGGVATTVRVSGTLRIDLGGRVLEVSAWGPAHTRTDVTVRDEASGILFAGDLVFDDHAPALDGSLPGWQAVLEELGAGSSVVVPGHGGPVLPWPDGADRLRRYLDVLAAEVRAAIAEGRRIGEVAATVAASEAGEWSLFEVYNPRNATQAYTELEWE